MAFENLGSMALSQGQTLGYKSQEDLRNAQQETQQRNATAAAPGVMDAAGKFLSKTPMALGYNALVKPHIQQWDASQKDNISAGFDAARSLSGGHFDRLATEALGPNANPNGSYTPAAATNQPQDPATPTEQQQQSTALTTTPQNAQNAPQGAQRQLGTLAPQSIAQNMYSGLQNTLGDITQKGQERSTQQIRDAEMGARLKNIQDGSNRQAIANSFVGLSKSLGMGGDYGKMVAQLVARKINKNANQEEMSAVDKVRQQSQQALASQRDDAIKAFNSQQEAFGADRQHSLEQGKLQMDQGKITAEQDIENRKLALEEMKANRPSSSSSSSLKFLEDDFGGAGKVFDTGTGQVYDANKINQFGSVSNLNAAQQAGLGQDEYQTAVNMIKSGQASAQQFKDQYGFIPNLG